MKEYTKASIAITTTILVHKVVFSSILPIIKIAIQDHKSTTKTLNQDIFCLPACVKIL